jgi:diguanylate cyclase (GGDEF)-like protein
MTAQALVKALMAGLLGWCLAAMPAAADTADAQRAELARLVLVARSQPERALPALDALLPQLASRPELEIEALMVLGQTHVLMAQHALMEQVVERLRGLGEAAPDPQTGAAGGAPHRAWARVAADAVRVQWMRRHGQAGRAERLLADALGRPALADAPAALRLQWTAQHALLIDQNGRAEEAVKRYQEAISLADAMPAPEWQRAELRSSLAYTLHTAGEKARARELIRAALMLAEASGDDKTLSSIHTNRAILLSTEAHGPINAEERTAMLAALEHARLGGARRDEVLATANLADLYLRHGDYREAIAYSERALPLARELHDDTSESVALANIGLAKIMLGRKDEGLVWVRRSIAIDERAGNQAELASMHSELGHYLERAGYHTEAYSAWREHRRLRSQLVQRDQQRRLVELQESFEHDQRQRELELLERESRLQRSQLVAQQLRQWLWAGGALFGLLVAALGLLLLMRLRQGNRALADTNARLAQLARRDALTGLANRRHYQAAMKAAPTDSLRGTLMLIDIDHFKQINDRWGHATGDAVLVEVARRLRAALREDDLIVRWGGEEFLVQVAGNDPVEAQLLVARLLESLAGMPVRAGRVLVPVSASIGFAAFPLLPLRWAPGWEAALELVDTAMYLAKAHGRNRGYGVHRVEAADAAALATLARELEAAWQDGRVELTVVEGPSREIRAAA